MSLYSCIGGACRIRVYRELRPRFNSLIDAESFYNSHSLVPSSNQSTPDLDFSTCIIASACIPVITESTAITPSSTELINLLKLTDPDEHQFY
jgi:hypothetical protein